MDTLGVTLRRRTLWIGFLAAFLPLLLLVGLQYWWLTRLEEASSLAGRAVLANLLDAIATDVMYAYAPAAERALDVPASVFTEERFAHAPRFFRQRQVEGARQFFAVRFIGPDDESMLFYDPRRDVAEAAVPSAATRAVTVACAPWRLMHAKAIDVETGRLVVEERDPENRIVLAPVVDRVGHVVGVAGLILDSDYFRSEVLPRTVKASVAKLAAAGAGIGVTVSVRDERGNPWFATDPKDNAPPDVSRPLSFVFTDLRLEVRNRDQSPEQLARRSFAFNLMLSVLAAALLTAGLAMALRTASREMRLSAMKSDFVSNVSHELRTPLASIRAFAELLKLGRVGGPEKVREYGQFIESESHRLTQLIDNILDFSRIESGARMYHLVPGDVGEVLARTLETLAERLKHEGFTLSYTRGEGALPAVRLDANALGQAFHNLLDNAIKYSGDARWIGVDLRAEGTGVAVTVSDRGIGIPKEEQRRIFDRFHRLGTGLVHDVRGTGLGLAIVQHVVRAHGGHVTVESERGRGSRFTIHLPGFMEETWRAS